MKRFVSYGDIPFVWDPCLPTGRIEASPDGTRWLVGVGTDLELLLYRANLTGSDVRFLKSLNIEVD